MESFRLALFFPLLFAGEITFCTSCQNNENLVFEASEKQTKGELWQLPSLAGNWTNQLGSVLSITTFSNGNVSGLYNSKVGEAVQEYQLNGRYLSVITAGYVMGWTVAWKNDQKDALSTTSWTGIYYASKDQILTQWILASFQDKQNFWKAFTTNQDVFSRQTKL